MRSLHDIILTKIFILQPIYNIIVINKEKYVAKNKNKKFTDYHKIRSKSGHKNTYDTLNV